LQQEKMKLIRDITTTHDDVPTTNSDVSDIPTPKQGDRDKTPHPKQDLGVMALVAITEPANENCLQGAPSSP
jgi:hypothetical protein